DPKRPNQETAGESFNSFKRRFLTSIEQLKQQHEADPMARTLAVTDYRGPLLEAWALLGMRADLAIDMKHMLKGEPAPVQHLRRTAAGKWKLSPADMKN